MTQYRSVVITWRTIQVIEHTNIEQAEDYEYKMRYQYPDVRMETSGDIDGVCYTVIYIVDADTV